MQMSEKTRLYLIINDDKLAQLLADFEKVCTGPNRYADESESYFGSLQNLINKINEVGSTHKKTYIITTDDLDEEQVIGISSTLELAQSFMDQFPDENFNKPREIIVDDLITIPKGKRPYSLCVYKNNEFDPDIVECSGGICILNAEVIRDNPIWRDDKGNFLIYVWAKDEEEAKKIALKLVKSHLESGKES